MDWIKYLLRNFEELSFDIYDSDLTLLLLGKNILHSHVWQIPGSLLNILLRCRRSSLISFIFLLISFIKKYNIESILFQIFWKRKYEKQIIFFSKWNGIFSVSVQKLQRRVSVQNRWFGSFFYNDIIKLCELFKI